MNRDVSVQAVKLFDSQDFASGVSAFSEVQDLRSSDGKVYLEYQCTGDGKMRVEAFHSIGGVNYNTRSASQYLWDELTSGNGVSTVKDLEVGAYVKVKAKNTSTSGISSFSLWGAFK
jgi:hypothetical protein